MSITQRLGKKTIYGWTLVRTGLLEYWGIGNLRFLPAFSMVFGILCLRFEIYLEFGTWNLGFQKVRERLQYFCDLF